ncbi:mitochondrial import inner membrane translocase [Tubulinosema ratisbonensis]|uniref:Mitochondrial import inner membrane translocase n=1 Tax=Tubulinosema ratisbonensis TaxID=291195 RepID=A0A437ALR1_9MICR|nr:mitochondrial import inner membrane translocase [Tubulinosema ratisbonensis]
MLEKILKIKSFFFPKLFGFKPKMDRSEAKLILNISKTDKNTVNNAYRKEIILMHPDNKGSKFICVKINEAKELLLK